MRHTIVLSLLAIFPSTAILQTTDDPVATIEEIVVTGSRIKRKDYFSTSPIFSIDKDAIKLSGITNVEDLLSDSPQFTPAEDRTSNNPGGGQARINLRGLGSNRTLVLQNGRRIAPSTVFGGVNANDIPSALVNRVEIVTGGASAVYGSDAVAGVVNFILDTEFDGINIDLQQDIYGEGDGKVSDVNVTFGKNFANGKANISGYFGYQDRQEVLHADRSISRQALIDDWDTGVITTGGSAAVPGGLVVFPPAILPRFGFTDEFIFTADGTARPFVEPDDLYNFAGLNYLQVPMKREIAGLFGHYDLTDETRVSLELTWSGVESKQQLAPDPFFRFVAQNVDHPSLTPYQQDLLADNYDFGDGIAQYFLLRRFVELGPRRNIFDTDSVRTALVFEGSTFWDFTWEASYIYSKTEGDDVLINTFDRSKLQQGLLADPASGQCFDPSDGCVPLSVLGEGTLTPEAVEFIKTNEANTLELSEQVAMLVFTGDLISSLDLQTAFGMEWRKQNGHWLASPALAIDTPNDVRGSTSLWEAYAEFTLPIISGRAFAESVYLEWGVRYSDYSEAESTTTWKAGVDWQVSDWLRLRAMQQRAIRAPNINELFRNPSESINPFGESFRDGCSAENDPLGHGLLDLCVSQGIPADQIGTFVASDPFPSTQIEGGGNRQLDSETADTTTVGIVLTPNIENDFSIALDYFEIELEDAITGLNTPIELCFELNDSGNDYCQLFTRGAGFNISEVNYPSFNQALQKTSGIDLQLNYSMPLRARWNFLGSDASFNLVLIASKVFENGSKADPLSSFSDCVGVFTFQFSNLCDTFMTPEARINITLAYNNSRFGTSLNWKWISGADNESKLLNDTTINTAIPSVGSYYTLDWSARYTLSESINLRFGVSNLLEEDPPLLADNGTAANTAPQLYDVFGRRFFLGLTFSY